jgi:hypothetical protein
MNRVQTVQGVDDRRQHVAGMALAPGAQEQHLEIGSLDVLHHQVTAVIGADVDDVDDVRMVDARAQTCFVEQELRPLRMLRVGSAQALDRRHALEAERTALLREKHAGGFAYRERRDDRVRPDVLGARITLRLALLSLAVVQLNFLRGSGD